MFLIYTQRIIFQGPRFEPSHPNVGQGKEMVTLIIIHIIIINSMLLSVDIHVGRSPRQHVTHVTDVAAVCFGKDL